MMDIVLAELERVEGSTLERDVGSPQVHEMPTGFPGTAAKSAPPGGRHGTNVQLRGY